MDITVKHPYPKGVEEVFQFFHDPGKVIAKLQAIGGSDVKITESSGDDVRFSITTERTIDADVPSMLKSVLNPQSTVTQKEIWEKLSDGSRKCQLAVDLSGVPVTISGSIHLQPEGDACAANVAIKVNCSIPFVGKKVAEFVGNDIKKSADQEYEHIKGQL